MSKRRMREPKGGWVIGKIEGRPAYSDGHAVFVGSREGAINKLKPGFMKAIRKHVSKGKNRQPVFIKGQGRKYRGEPTVVLGPLVQERYCNEARMRFPDVKFYLGKQTGRRGYTTEYAIVCESKGKLVGVILPVAKSVKGKRATGKSKGVK